MRAEILRRTAAAASEAARTSLHAAINGRTSPIETTQQKDSDLERKKFDKRMKELPIAFAAQNGLLNELNEAGLITFVQDSTNSRIPPILYFDEKYGMINDPLKASDISQEDWWSGRWSFQIHHP